MHRLILFLAAAGAMIAPSPAAACDCVRLVPGTARYASDLDRIAAFYPVVAEGSIERDGPYSWRFTPTREFRGPGRTSYPVALISDCSLSSDQMESLIGKPILALLGEGPGDHTGTYELSRCVNLLGSDIDEAIRKRVDQACP